MTTKEIINSINNDFGATYKNANPFINSGALWDFCIDVVGNPILMNCIVFANDLGVPPVRSLIEIYKRTKKPNKDFSFTAQESQCLGALMGYVFKYVLNYKNQKERCTVNELGIKTATRFLDGPVVIIDE